MILPKAIFALTLAIGLSAETPREAIANLANALSTDNPPAFLQSLTPKLADELRPLIEGLCARYEIVSSIEILREETMEIEADWYLELKERATAATVIRRRQRVNLKFETAKRGVKIRELQPRDFFSPSP